MDCLEGMKQIPDGSVDAVICDLPYGTMKGAQLDGWEGVKTDWDEIIPTDKLFEQYERVLRMNGVAILFSQEPYTNHLRGYQYRNTNFGFGYPLMWRKNHFANALIAKNAPVSYFEDISVFFKRFDTSGHHPLRDYFSAVMSYIGATSAKQINERLGHRKAEHSFYVSPKQLIMQEIGGKADHTFRNGSTQFALCTAETYQEIIDKFHIDKMEGFKPYDELQRMDARFKRTFNLPEGQGFKSNVFEYAKDPDGFHPTQKPVSLIRDLVLT
jgi:site-specific DNA-methyltransferase (adenine-specific)